MDEKKIKDMEMMLLELRNYATTLSSKEAQEDPAKALKTRSVIVGRLCAIGTMLDDWYNERAFQIMGNDNKMSEWKLKVLMGQTIEGRLSALRDRLVNTIKIQSRNMESIMIDTMADRKLSKNQQ